VQLVVGSVLLAPIRLVLILLLLVLAVLLVKIALLGLSVRDIHDKPFTRWRKNVLLLVRCSHSLALSSSSATRYSLLLSILAMTVLRVLR
jgi:Na+-transporting NADH:ubiquinone oxidoreductase subunit NqrF